MAALTAQQITVTGITPTWAAAASGGDTFENNGVEWLEVWNDHASASRTVTITTTKTVEGLAVADRTVVITAANDCAKVGPFAKDVYSGTVNIAYSDSAADCRVGIFKI